jgi:hypothetical protein
MPLPQAPKRQDNKSFPTPLVGDVLFSQIEDCTRRTFPAYGTAHPDTVKWPDHKLCYIRSVDNERDGIHEFFYVADRANQDTYNWEFDKADIGGVTFDAVTRTYVTLRTAFDSAAPAMGAAMPNIPASKFSGSYVLARRKQQRIGDRELDSLYVVDQRTYVKRCSIRSIGVDSMNGLPLQSVETLYYATEVVTGTTTAAALFAAPTNAYWGLQSDGYVRTGRQLSCEWYQITSEQQVAGTLTSGVISVSTFNTTKNYYWPPVLQKLGTSPNFFYVDFMNWTRLDGGVDIYPRFTFEQDGYNGPCEATITRSWSKTPQTVTAPKQMLPTPIYYSSPYFSLNIPACLHGEVTCKCDIGNADPVYTQNVGSSRTTPRTNHLVWPDFIIAADDQDPYRGGYLRTTVTISKPNNTAV